MTFLSEGRLLKVWEQAAQAPGWQRPLIVLVASNGDKSGQDLAALSVGSRNAQLLELRKRVFGRVLTGVVSCPDCRARWELTLDAADLEISNGRNSQEALTLQAGDYEVRFRLPNSLDLAAVSECSDVPQARRLIFQRCVLNLNRQGIGTSAEEAPESVLEAVAQRMAEADPNGDAQVELTCAACCRRWNAPFDIATYFWMELNRWAYRRLEEVHILASAYGWSEADILQLSPVSRRYYLEAVAP